MNAVEIEEAISELAEQPFDANEFPFSFLQAFGAKDTTLRKLRKGETNRSDVGGVLQRDNIHIAVAPLGSVEVTLAALRNSPATARWKAKFIVATDGIAFAAEDLESGETVDCSYADFAAHFGFFLPLAGISYTKEIKEIEMDMRAARRLNQLYVRLLEDNPDWGSAERHHDMNHFMARLIFCFFAEDTDIFSSTGLFTSKVNQMSARDSSNTHEVIGEIFRAMNTKIADRKAARLHNWANEFPYVNGGLFSGNIDVPRFSRIARTYLLRIGGLDWKKINPDIFGSMIQAVADDNERDALGMHYTSVPNILKVLNPLFLDDLRQHLEDAGDNGRKLLNLRNRMARIRVFDPACGSGNFLVIAYKEMREIEAEINKRRNEADRKSDIPLTNFRGIELRDFPAEIARLALIIAEFQCNVLYRGQQLALNEFLPLNSENWITRGNALQIRWHDLLDLTGTGTALRSDDLLEKLEDQAEVGYANQQGETYICGNPPYSGQSEMSEREKEDLASVFAGTGISWKSLDYVLGWFKKAVDICSCGSISCAFVATNSVCQGQQVPAFWESALRAGTRIHFARTSFKWANLAKNNAGVIVVVVGIDFRPGKATLYVEDDKVGPFERVVDIIGPYLVPDTTVIVHKESKPINGLPPMDYGSKPADGGGLVISAADYLRLDAGVRSFVKPYLGSNEYIDGTLRYCLWITADRVDDALEHQFIRDRLNVVRNFRLGSSKPKTREQAQIPYAFAEIRHGKSSSSVPLIVPIHTSENRSALPVGALEYGAVVSNAAFGLYDAPLWNLAIIASRLHLVWIATVCGKIKRDFRYANTLGWNTFPLTGTGLSDKNKADLTRCAEDILLAREANFPKSIADLYDPEKMPVDLREAHERNDEVLERIYIGRRFRNDTERLEKLFDLYTKMTTSLGMGKKRKAGAAA